MVFKKDLIVLQLSVRYCNNGGAINPENLEKKGSFSKKARKKAKRVQKPRNIIDRAN